MAITNITGLEEPLKKLVETVSEGIGVVGNHFFEFDVAKIKRIGNVQAEVDKKRIIANAEAQEKAVDILSRAEKRFALEQYNKQINFENILVKTREDLKGKLVSEDPVERDWTMKFLDIAQNVSREEIQNVLAKILSGEIQKPGSYSYQTLEIIKYFSRKDLQIFLKFVAISTEIGVIKLHGNSNDSLTNYGLSFTDYLDLSSIGLFNQSSTLVYDIKLLPGNQAVIYIGTDSYVILNKDQEKTKNIDFGLYIFSNTSKELRSILLNQSANEKSDLFKENFLVEIRKKGLEVLNHK